jgi:hypothetical protein
VRLVQWAGAPLMTEDEMKKKLNETNTNSSQNKSGKR